MGYRPALKVRQCDWQRNGDRSSLGIRGHFQRTSQLAHALLHSANANPAAAAVQAGKPFSRHASPPIANFDTYLIVHALDFYAAT